MSAAAPPVLWEPSPERIEQTMLWRFLQGHGFSSYDAAWRWSVADPEAFWTALSDFFAVGWDVRPDRFLADARMPGAVWCPGGRVSYAEHVFRDRDPDAVALHHASELRELSVMSWAQLAALSARIAAALRREGVVPGDRVVAYLPNIPEAVAALLACASIGASWSSCSPDFGVSSVVDRFAQIEPTVLLAVDGYRYGGENFDRRDVVTELQDAMPTLRRSVLLAYLDADATLAGTVGWDAWLADGEPRRSASRRWPSTTRSGCSTRAAPPGCPRRSSTGRAASSSSSSSSSACTPTRGRATGCSGSPPRAG